MVLIHSNSTENREFQKNSKKILKIQKTSLWPFFKPKRDGTGWEWKKIKLSFLSIPTRLRIWNSKKIARKCKKLRNIIMALFEGKTWRDRLCVIPKKKSYRSDPFQQDLELKIPKNSKKMQKMLSFRSIPTRLRIRNSKKIAKKCKKLRNIIMALFQGKTWQNMLSVIQKKKSYRSDPFQQDLN